MGVTRGRPRGFDRDAALEQAMLLFWERGYEVVAIRDLAAAMEISLTSMYAAFGGKRALFEAAVDRYAERYGRYIEAAIRAESTRAAVGELLSTAAIQQSLPGRPAGCLIINGATNYGPASTDLAAGLRKRRAHVIDAIEAIIRADIRSGDLPAHTDAHALAGTVGAVWQGMAQLARDGATGTDLEAIARAAISALGLDDPAVASDTGTAPRESITRRCGPVGSTIATDESDEFGERPRLSGGL